MDFFFVYDLENAPVKVQPIPLLGALILHHVVMKQERPTGHPDTDAWGGSVVAFCTSKEAADMIAVALNHSKGT